MKHQTANSLRWSFIFLFFLVTLATSTLPRSWISAYLPVISVFSLFIVVILHGYQRVGMKSLALFFLITWLVSHFFEALSIKMGFPFGHYYYNQLIGPRLFNVPLVIMPAYFGMIYVSWTLATILLQQYSARLQGRFLFFIPLIASFIMVMWDLCMDPRASTMGSLWTWRNGGEYFGVPLQNYFGWFLVVYLIFQLFAWTLYKFENIDHSKKAIVQRKSFWMEAITLYAIRALAQLIDPFTHAYQKNPSLIGSMALITFFTMFFVALLAIMTLYSSSTLRAAELSL